MTGAHDSIGILKSSTGLINFAIAASVLLEKFAIPGTASTLSCSLVVLVLLTATLFLQGRFLIEAGALAALLAFLMLGTIDVCLNIYTKTSAPSLALVGVLQALLLFRLRADAFEYRSLVLFYSDLAAVSALIGILQFVAQYTLGSSLAFYLDFHLPSSILLKGFNNLNPLYYGSNVYKPNGFFFLEPSYFNQILAIGVIAEVTTRARKFVIAILAMAMVVTYSGTGLVMLFVLLPYIMLRAGDLRILLLALAGGLGLWLLAGTFQLGLIVDRAAEFTDDKSSGFARFFGAFLLLGHALSAADGSLYFGRGPGTVSEFATSLSFESFDPTWAKIAYEYGLIGAALYTVFFALTVGGGRRGLRFAVGFTYLVLGGYLADPTILTLVATLVVWPGGRICDVPHLTRSKALLRAGGARAEEDREAGMPADRGVRVRPGT